jgi:hypothetical protein
MATISANVTENVDTYASTMRVRTMPALNLTTAEISKIVNEGSWYFQLAPDPLNVGSHVITSDGVDEIDFVANQLEIYSQAVLQVDIGLFGGSFKQINVSDLAALRTAFIQRWGEVNKGSEYTPT